MKVAACFTQGDADYLMVGRNGVFYDRKGRDWDATIVKIVDNPISIRQAFWAPYKKAVRLVEEQIARFAATKAKAVDERMESATSQGADAVLHQKAPARPEPADIGKMVGIIAALGVGVGALGTLLGGFVSGFLELRPWWAKLVAVAGMVLVVSGPSVLVAWLKLRHRTLGPILDACGWAVNGRVRINFPLGGALTDLAVLPPGARRVLDDPYADEGARRRRRAFWALVVLVAAALAATRWLGVWPFGPFPWRR
jgi:MFS family permease